MLWMMDGQTHLIVWDPLLWPTVLWCLKEGYSECVSEGVVCIGSCWWVFDALFFYVCNFFTFKYCMNFKQVFFRIKKYEITRMEYIWMGTALYRPNKIQDLSRKISYNFSSIFWYFWWTQIYVTIFRTWLNYIGFPSSRFIPSIWCLPLI